ncbi:MAG TPA: hypothetical protein VG710_04195 [Opitutus sp.]|nr:hypothetical protein [Opitutus sp.]
MTEADQSTAASLPRHATWLVAAAIVALATAARCLFLDKSLWCDEADSYIRATAGDFIAAAHTNVHPPLYFLLLRGLAVVVHSFAGLRLFSVACGVATVVVMLRTGPTLAGWLAGLLVACAPEMVYQSQELRQYAFLSLLLLIALLCTLRLSADPPSPDAAIGLAVSLAAAAATHLATGFFMAPLALTLGWSHRRLGLRRLVALGALFLPAAAVLFFFHSIFLTAAKNLDRHTWWMAPANGSDATQAFSIATGWDSIHWVAQALGRHMPLGETALIGVVAAAVIVVLWVAWFPRPGRLVLTLLAIAVIYWALIVGYSFTALSILMPRIILPGMLPLFLSIAAGVAERRPGWPRRAAVFSIGVYALVGLIPWFWHFAWIPREDLRGLIDVVRENRPAGEPVVFVGGTDVAVDAYWPEFKSSPRQAKISLLAPLPPQLPELRAALAKRAPGTGALLVYRVDGYFHSHRNEFEMLLAALAAQGLGPPQSIWERTFYHVVRLPASPAK